MLPLLMTVIYHSKDAGVRCEVDPRLKNISASIATSAGDMTACTVLIRWELQNSMQPHHFEVECSAEQHKTTISVSNIYNFRHGSSRSSLIHFLHLLCIGFLWSEISGWWAF